MTLDGPRSAPHPHEVKVFDLEEWRHRSFELSVRLVLLIQIPVFVWFLWLYLSEGGLQRAWFMAPVLLVQLFAGFARQIGFRVRAWALLLVLFGVGVAMTVNSGFLPGTTVLFVTTICFAMVFLGWREAAAFTGAYVLALAGAALGFSQGWLVQNPEVSVDPTQLVSWVGTGLTVLVLLVLIVLAMSYLIQGMEQSVNSSQALVARLEEEAEERRRALAELEQAQQQLDGACRMEVLTQLTAGFVHDLNNNLTVILAQAELMGIQRAKGAEHIRDAALHAATFSKQLLGLARHRVSHVQVVDLGMAMPSMLKTVKRTLPADVALDWETDPGLVARIDPTHLQQILLNLCINARDAMPEGGMIRVTCHRVEAEQGRVARVEVQDEGTGMDEATLARATEPLFTTKELGHGTGLGLFNVKTMVEEHGGTLTLHSTLGQGTLVRIDLPLTDDVPTDLPAPPRVLLRGKGQQVLVVDDDLRVGEVLVRQLEELGYEATAVSGVRTAIRHLQDNPVQLLITDVVMPEGGASALVECLDAHKPHVPLIICSGYSHDETVRRGIQADRFPFLQKPYQTHELLMALQAALNLRSSAEAQRE